MAKEKSLTVDYAGGVCLRAEPSVKARIVKVLLCGEKVKPTGKEAPNGWTAVEGGYTMTKYLR